MHQPAEKISLRRQNTVFPLPFVPHRWVDNVPVLERALSLWEHLEKYREATRNRKLPLPNSRSYETISAFMKDQLGLTKLHFCLNVAMIMQPLLTFFQSDAPRTFLVAKDLESVLRTLVTRFVKCSSITQATSITKLLQNDPKDPGNYTQLEKLDVGRAAVKILKKQQGEP
ncbi:hypothetical protein HPB47_005548 [Ixodes persulcatus]|uniref:Uncharacterized protein n=1 Tax=Ixodes persulcatus TaxID=34615 RepID=A0AC60PDI7_IXOPE|nr:hypothetical protein HPB47_005548 [Ixodes persulcatus]